jgi:hypothetical protein
MIQSSYRCDFFTASKPPPAREKMAKYGKKLAKRITPQSYSIIRVRNLPQFDGHFKKSAIEKVGSAFDISYQKM